MCQRKKKVALLFWLFRISDNFSISIFFLLEKEHSPPLFFMEHLNTGSSAPLYVLFFCTWTWYALLYYLRMELFDFSDCRNGLQSVAFGCRKCQIIWPEEVIRRTILMLGIPYYFSFIILCSFVWERYPHGELPVTVYRVCHGIKTSETIVGAFTWWNHRWSGCCDQNGSSWLL